MLICCSEGGVGKHGDKSRVAVFIGYYSDRSAYKLWNTTQQKVVVSRDVFFDKNKFGFADFANASLSSLNASVRNIADSQLGTKLSPLYKA